MVLVYGGLLLWLVVASQIPGRLDVSGERLYSIGPESREVVGQIEEPVEFEFYFSRRSEILPVSIKNYALRIEELLKSYRRVSGGKIKLRVFDPAPDSLEELAAVKSGLVRRPLSRTEQILFGLILRSGEEKLVIPFFSPEREPFLEYDISSLLLEISSRERSKVGLYSPLRLAGVEEITGLKRPGLADAFVDALKRMFEVETVRSLERIGEMDLDLLIMVHPGRLSGEDLFALDQYVLGGGPLFLALDPSHFRQRIRDQSPGQVGLGTVRSDLPQLLGVWGLTYRTNEVVADPLQSLRIQDPASRLLIDYPIWMEVREVNREAIFTNQIDTLHLIEAGRLTIDAGKQDVWEVLLRSTEAAGVVDPSSLNRVLPSALSSQISLSRGEAVLAASFRGRLMTAFPEGRPLKNPDDEMEKFLRSLSDPKDTQLMESRSDSQMVIISDVDFLLDEFALRESEFAGGQTMVPANDNLALALNIVDALAGKTELLAIRGKGTTIRRFERFATLRSEAEAIWEDRIRELEADLRKVQSEITRLEEEAAGERTEALDQALEQERLLRVERRSVYRSLTAAVDSQRVGLALFNFFFLPGFTALCGMIFFYRRTSGFRKGIVSSPKK